MARTATWTCLTNGVKRDERLLDVGSPTSVMVGTRTLVRTGRPLYLSIAGAILRWSSGHLFTQAVDRYLNRENSSASSSPRSPRKTLLLIHSVVLRENNIMSAPVSYRFLTM